MTAQQPPTHIVESPDARKTRCGQPATRKSGLPRVYVKAVQAHIDGRAARGISYPLCPECAAGRWPGQDEPPSDCAKCGHPTTAHQAAVTRLPGPCAVCGCRRMDYWRGQGDARDQAMFRPDPRSG